MNKLICPECSAGLVEGASENIMFNKDGTIVMDGFPALVCEEKCGYTKRLDADGNQIDSSVIRMPNLFRFATSELSQDAFLCWLLSWGIKEYQEINRPLYDTSLDFLRTIFELHHLELPEVESLEIIPQHKKLDILVIVNDTFAVLIEDKTFSKDHSNQLVRYKEAVKKDFPDLIQLPIYYKIADQSNYHSVEKAEYRPFTRRTMLEIMKNGLERGINNDIFLDYYNHLQELENSIQAFRTKPVAKWNANQWQGFYQEVKQHLEGNWGYVSNPRQGFWGFWCFSSPVHGWYLQLEQNKLCIKILLKEKENRVKYARTVMQEVLQKSAENNLKLEKPARLRAGKTMTIAQRMYYIQTDEEGVIDLDQTIKELMKY